MTGTRHANAPEADTAPPSRRKVGRPAYRPGVKDRKLVEDMVAVGIDQDRISEVMGLSPKTLRKHFAETLDFGLDRVRAKVGGNLVAMTKKHPAAAFGWLYNRFPEKWQDRRRLDIRVEDDRPDFSQYSEETLAQIEALAQLLEAPMIEGTAIEVDETPAEAEGVPAAK